MNAQTNERWRITAPLETHWQPATCREVDCPHWLQGWTTIVPDPSPQAEYIRHDSGRRFIEKKNDEGTVTFSFYQGQTCFREHKRKFDDKLENFIHRGWDQGRQLMEPTQWTDGMNEATETFRKKRREG